MTILSNIEEYNSHSLAYIELWARCNGLLKLVSDVFVSALHDTPCAVADAEQKIMQVPRQAEKKKKRNGVSNPGLICALLPW